ncbi:MAG: DNA-binding protein [Thermoleophilia bacterium]
MREDLPLDADELRRWREEADRALRSARIQAEAGVANWACFLAEQAAQLGLKGLLHGLGRGPWGHDLVRLAEMVSAAGVELPAAVSDSLKRLSRHYIPARYPDAHGAGSPGAHYSRADAEEAIADAEAALRFVDDTWESLGG